MMMMIVMLTTLPIARTGLFPRDSRFNTEAVIGLGHGSLDLLPVRIDAILGVLLARF